MLSWEGNLEMPMHFLLSIRTRSYLEKIAGEKGGIIKKDIPVVIGTTQKETTPVFRDIATSVDTNLFFADQEYIADYAMLGLDGNQILSVENDREKVYPDLKLDLKGLYQLKNLPAVLKTIEILNEGSLEISDQNIYDGLQSVQKNTGLLGRWQVIGNNPLIICDTGHNEDGIKAIVKQIGSTAYKTLHFIFGTVADKDPDPVLALLPKDANYYFVKADIERAMNEVELMERAKKFNLNGKYYSSVNLALEEAQIQANQQDLIFVGGSTFVVAEVL